MARKKSSATPLTLEERPEFIAALGGLPADPQALQQLAASSLALFNDAVCCNAQEKIDSAILMYEAVVYRLNGDTFLGCGVEGGSADKMWKALARQPGLIPGWGQPGTWLLEVEGMRVRVKHNPWSIGGMSDLEFRAIDPDEPFISDTGYWSHFIRHENWLGHDFGAAVRLELERLMATECKPVSIQDEYRARIKVPAWLSAVRESVTGNGQQPLLLSGRESSGEPGEPEAPKVPMTTAERQRLFRARQKEQRAQKREQGLRDLPVSAAEHDQIMRWRHSGQCPTPSSGPVWHQGDRESLQPVMMSLTDLAFVWCALDDSITFRNEKDQLKDDWLRQMWIRIFAGTPMLEKPGIDSLGESMGVLNREKQRSKDAKRGWDAYRDERKRSDDLVAKLNNSAAELKGSRAEIEALQQVVLGLQDTIKEIGEVMQVPASVPAPAVPGRDELAQLRRDLEAKNKEIALMWEERRTYSGAYEVLEQRLRNAGLSTDYRPQPGEGPRYG